MPRWSLAAFALALVGCGALLGSDDYATEATSTGYRDPADLLPAACRPCILEHCGASLEACAQDSECDAGSHCLYVSINPATAAACTKQHPDGTATATPFAECTQAACSDCVTPAAWACVGDYVWPPPNASTATAKNRLIDFVTSSPLSGVQVSACDRRDPGCTDPFDVQKTDADGWATLTVPMLKKSSFGVGADGFDGFLLIEGPDLPPTYHYESQPTVDSYERASTVASSATIAALSQLIQVSLAPARAVLVAEVKSCFTVHAAGVRFEVDTADAASTLYYLDNGLPSTKLSATTTNGIGGYVNLPPGQTTVVAFEEATGREVARSVVQTFAGAVTLLVLLPSP